MRQRVCRHEFLAGLRFLGSKSQTPAGTWPMAPLAPCSACRSFVYVRPHREGSYDILQVSCCYEVRPTPVMTDWCMESGMDTTSSEAVNSGKVCFGANADRNFANRFVCDWNVDRLAQYSDT